MIANFLEETDIFRDIVGLLRFVKVSKSRITFWQKDETGNRTMFYGKIERINLEKKTMSFKVEDGAKFHVNRHLHIYVHGEEKSILFKGEAKASDPIHLLMPIPKTVRYLNKRYNQRFRLSDQYENRAILMKKSGVAQKEKTFTLRIHDVSLDGISFQMHPHHLEKYRVDDEFTLIELAGIELDHPVKAKIIYIQGLPNRKGRKLFRAGVRLEEEISSEVLKQVIIQKDEAA